MSASTEWVVGGDARELVMEEDLREQLAPRPGVCLWWRFSDHRRRWGDRVVAFEFGAASAPALDDVE